MGYLQDVRQSVGRFMNSSTSNPARWFLDYFGGKTDSGVNVSYNTSLTYAYVWSAVSMIASDIASLPLNVRTVEDNGDSEIAKGSQTQWLLNEEPNELMDALTFRETLTSHVLLWGNGYAAIERDGSQRPLRLIPMLPDRTEVKFDDEGKMYYETRETREAGSKTTPLQPRDVLHIRGMGWDGTQGHSVIALARNSWGLGMAAQKHGEKYFGSGARPSIVLRTDARLDKEQADMLLARWDERHADDVKPALLSNGLEIQPFSMSNEDSQWLESRSFQRTEVAVWFKMPPHKLGDSSRMAYNSIEAENRSYINQCLKGWLCKWESECRRKLLTERARKSYTVTVKHDTQDMLMADIETQVDVLVKLRNAELINRNEGRRKLGFSGVDGGDDFTNPNVRPADRDANDTPAEPVENVDARVLNGQRRLLADRIGRMVDIEAKAATKAAAKGGNFVNWVDEYYETFTPKVAESVDLVLSAYSLLPGAQCETTATDYAAKHAEQSRQMLLEVAGYSDADTLGENIAEAVTAWPERANLEATDIMKG